jgi:hypothetical protein
LGGGDPQAGWVLAMLPKLIHFVFGMAPQQGAGEFGLHHYLCLKSARLHHPGHKLVLWYGHAPAGNRYWDAAARFCEMVHTCVFQ